MKNLVICLMLILLLPIVSNETYMTAYSTDLDLYNTYLGYTRGPPGTTLKLKLDTDGEILYHTGVFDGNGVIYIPDIFNRDTGIETTVVPSTKDFMEVYGNNVLFSAAQNGTKGDQAKVLSVKAMNYTGQVVDKLNFVDHGDYVTANWDGKRNSNSIYYLVVETDKGITARPTTYMKDATSGHIPDFMFDKLAEHNAKQSLENIVVEQPSRSKAISNATFTYLCDTTGTNQHETSVFYETINTASGYFTPEHNLTPLKQQLDADFKILDGLTGEYITDASARVLNGEKEIIGTITPNDGTFSLENLPTDSTFYIQVSHPTLRNMEYDFKVPIRTTLRASLKT